MNFNSSSYEERAAKHPHPVARSLFEIMVSKKTNLCLSVDLTSSQEILALTDKLGPYICLLKTHVDIIEDFDPDFISKLSELSLKHNFLIFEDRKFADIGSTVIKQYGGGIYKIAEWVHITNCHVLPGPGIVDGLKSVTRDLPPRALLILAEMSSKGNLLTDEYTKTAVEIAKNNTDFVIGFIAQHRVSEPSNDKTTASGSNADFIIMTPGVSLPGRDGDSFGQQYTNPETAICVNGTDVLIVGRDLFTNPDPVSRAKEYVSTGWNAYLKRINKL
ncbi:hypothetical protein BB560_003705 [Smittium megazygosporum]|uniref:Orotidine 5'-phosphate decarboxylase n=1 Tax=Smittium megazygosporum TaxID=133381 RepID=A0A2T9ZBB5_9FUNG|nr:hypothetical protein BB560_003705 [Smittium megazygosporum]